MPRGTKERYTEKQKRTTRVASATTNKEYGKAGAKKVKSAAPAKRGGKKGGASARRKKRTLH